MIRSCWRHYAGWPASLALLFTATVPVHANDTLAVLGAGGLELVTTEHIEMASEDLYLSPSEVRVRYAFRNASDRDITTTVAFPLPAIDQSAIANIELPVAAEQNFVDFLVKVDGETVETALEQKALLDDGTDVTAVLAKAGLPINTRSPGWDEKLAALPDDVWQDLVAKGLFDTGDGPANRDDEVSPLWDLQATFHWQQRFPAGKTITVDHSYKPIRGGGIVYSGDDLTGYGDYCLDESGAVGVRRLLRAAQAEARKDPLKSPGVAAVEVEYVLTTGANWKGAIGDFHLTIDKENPRAVLSLCMSGLNKTGSSRFEWKQANFTPKEDVRFVLFLPDE